MSFRNEPPDAKFMDYVQRHERIWGTETYSGRPDLVDILTAPVVVFWRPERKTNQNEDTDQPETESTDPTVRHIVSLHTSLREIEEYFVKLILRGNLEAPKQRIVAIFKDQKRVRVKGVKIEFSLPD